MKGPDLPPTAVMMFGRPAEARRIATGVAA
jgi:hypothetical protein